MRRVLAVLATSVLALALPTAAAADEAPAPVEMPYPVANCSVLMPATLSISRPVTTYHIRLGGDCDPDTFGWARWTVHNPRTGATVGQLYSDDTDIPMALTWDDDLHGYGTFGVRPVAAFDVEMNPLTQNEPTVVVKARARSSLAVTRNRVSVTATVSAAYYNARLNRTIPWAGAQVELQQAKSATGPWTTVRTLTAGPAGMATVSLWAHDPRWWRVVTPTMRSVFASSTAPVFR